MNPSVLELIGQERNRELRRRAERIRQSRRASRRVSPVNALGR